MGWHGSHVKHGMDGKAWHGVSRGGRGVLAQVIVGMLLTAQVIVGMAQPAEALRCQPSLRSLYRIMGSPFLSSLPLFPLSPSTITATTIDLSSQNLKCEQGGMALVTLKGRIQLRSKLFNCLLLPPHYDSLPTQTSDINSC